MATIYENPNTEHCPECRNEQGAGAYECKECGFFPMPAWAKKNLKEETEEEET